MSSTNSFGTSTQCTLAGESVEIFSLSKLEQAFPNVATLPYSLKILLENLLRHEDARFVQTKDIEALAALEARRAAPEGDFVCARACPAPGLHRRPLRRRSCRDARRHDSPRRQSRSRQPAAARRARHRSLCSGRLLRPQRRVSAERRARVRAKPGAVFLPAVGAGRVQEFPRRAA